MMSAPIIVAMPANDDHPETVVVMIVTVYVAHMGGSNVSNLDHIHIVIVVAVRRVPAAASDRGKHDKDHERKPDLRSRSGGFSEL